MLKYKLLISKDNIPKSRVVLSASISYTIDKDNKKLNISYLSNNTYKYIQFNIEFDVMYILIYDGFKVILNNVRIPSKPIDILWWICQIPKRYRYTNEKKFYEHTENFIKNFNDKYNKHLNINDVRILNKDVDEGNIKLAILNNPYKYIWENISICAFSSCDIYSLYAEDYIDILDFYNTYIDLLPKKYLYNILTDCFGLLDVEIEKIYNKRSNFNEKNNTNYNFNNCIYDVVSGI